MKHVKGWDEEGDYLCPLHKPIQQENAQENI